MKFALALFLLLTFSTYSLAESQFCAGFELGYKTVKGNMSLVPLCPLEPIAPLGSSPFQEGIKAGMQAASQ